MLILMLLLVLTGTANGADIYDEQSNRIGRTEERQGRIEVYDTQSNRIGEGLRQPDGSIDFRDPQGNRIGRTGPPSTDGSVRFDDARSNRVGQGKPDATGRYQYEDRGSTRRGSGDASGPVWFQRGQRK
jgi:hypothetical protein